MKYNSFGLAFVAAALLTGAAYGVAFTPGNLAVYRVGDGGAALTNAGTAIFIDEYTPAGTFVQSIPMPTTASGTNRRLVGQGTAALEGLINLSTNGEYLLLTGYDADPGASQPANTLASTVNRVVARIDANGVVDTSTVIPDLDDGTGTSSGSPRSAISTNGTDIWVVGAEGGVRYTTFGSASATAQLNSDTTNLRHIDIFGDQLYVTSMSGQLRVGSVGLGVPTASGQTITSLPGLPAPGATTATNPDPVQIFMADLSSEEPGVDTLYIADERSQNANGGLSKYSLISGSWTASGSIVGIQTPAVSVMRGLTGSVNGSTVILYATRNNNEILSFTDASGFGGTLSGSATVLATAGTNTAFKGIDFVPAAASPGLTGDYNNDDKVDAADYVVWRNTGGTQQQYDDWRANFGTGAGSGASLNSGTPAAVPEPAMMALCLLSFGPLATLRRRRLSQS